MKRKIHISWLITIYLGAFLVGVVLAVYFRTLPLAYLLFSFLLAGAGFWIKKIYIIPLLVMGGIVFGIWRGSLLNTELSYFEPIYDKVVQVEGVVKEDVDLNSDNTMTIRLGDLEVDNKKLPGVLWVTVNKNDVKRGDKLQVSGKLQKGFGNFSGIIYRAKIDKIIQLNNGDIALNIRDNFSSGVRGAIPDPEASLGIGYLLGQRRALPTDLILAMQVVGVTHIVVASGYNLTILVRLVRRLFYKISKYLSALFSGMLILGFISITGLSPSMLRAGLVAGLSLLAWYYGRKFHPVVLLVIAMALTVFINPGYIWGDLGWWLSFAAFAGVMIIAPLFQSYFFGNNKLGAIRQILGETIAAQVATAPIIILAFGQFSNVAILANLLILPFVPLAMLLTFFAGLAGILAPSAATIIGLPANLLLNYMIKVIEYLSGLPWASSSINVNFVFVIVYYAIVASICIYVKKVTKFKLQEVNLIE